MAKDFDHIGNEQRRYTPTPGRVHPKDGSLVHYVTTRYVKTAKDGSTRNVVLRGVAGDDRPCKTWGLTEPDRLGEEIRKARETLVKSRSKQAGHGSTSKTQRFIPSNRQVDARLDNPVQTTLAPRVWEPRRENRRASLRSQANRTY